jgi:cell division protein FtsI/penicillin-binding protein 2
MLSKRRIRIVTSAIALLFTTALLRTVQVQVVEFPLYAQEASAQQIARVNTLAPRGTIYDRNGNVLAVSNRAFIMRVSTRNITDTIGAAHVAGVIAPALGEPADVLRTRIEAIITDARSQTRTLPSIIAYNVTPKQVEDFKAAIIANNTTRGARYIVPDTVWPEENWTRSYPFKALAGPTVGFTTLFGNNYSGVEAFANAELQETRGRRTGRTRIDLIDSKPTLSGADVVLALDMNLQAYVEQRLAKAIRQTGAKSGTILVMDTRTGKILASASAPGYDPNRVLELAANPDTARWLKDPAASDMYEPGSVMKLCTIAAAIDAGVISPNTTYFDSGRIIVEGKAIRNSDLVGHGNVDLTTTLAKSLNVVLVQIAQQMGPDQFYRGMQAFGIGNRTGIDLGGEAAGTLRTPSDEAWSKIDLATNSYGQGMAATPYQVLNAINAIGNDGILVQPYVIQEWRDADGNVIAKQPVQLQRAISAETSRIMRRIMMDATMSATPEVAPKGYTVAGKTGTADWYLRGIKQETTIVTYAGFIPAEQPRLTILVKLDQPRSSRWAKETTAPVFHDVAERAVRLLGVPPDTVAEE